MVSEWGPEISTQLHPSALVPDADMLTDAWAPADGATYQARAGAQSVQDLVAVVWRLGMTLGYQAGRMGRPR
jgi:hypothetical protein